MVRHVGVGALFEEFVDDLGQEVYREAIEQESIDPFAVASLDNIEMEPLRYSLTIPLAPEVKLGDYRSVRVDEPEIEVDEEVVQARIDEVLERQADYKTVERAGEYGDLITIDVRAVVLDDEGNETDTIVLDETDWDVTPDEENPMEPAGFDEELLGISAGEEKTFDIAWPEDSPSMYAGNNVRFQVKVHEIKAYITPELTDEVAQEIGEYETAEAFIESVRDAVREEQKAEAEAEYFNTVMDQLVEISELDYPPAAVEMQIDQMLRNTDQQLRQMGLQGIQHYLQLVGRSANDYREEQREQAESNLRRGLVLDEIAKAEQIKAKKSEFESRLEDIFGPLNEDAGDDERESREGVLAMMRQEGNRHMIEEQIISEKTVERVLAIARGDEVPEPGADNDDEDEEEAEEAPVAEADAEAVEAEIAEAEADSEPDADAAPVEATVTEDAAAESPTADEAEEKQS
ncbi:MAG: trigger factor [Caldilineaceae bacterium]